MHLHLVIKHSPEPVYLAKRTYCIPAGQESLRTGLRNFVTRLADPLMLCFWLALSRFQVNTHQAFITFPQVVPRSSAALPGLFCTCRAAATDACSNTPLTLEPQRSARWTVDALTGWTVQGMENLWPRSSAI